MAISLLHTLTNLSFYPLTMKNFIVLVATAFLCLVAFPTTTVGKYWPKIEGWPNPSEISRNELMVLNTGHSFGYGVSKVWKCTYSNGSAPAISISPSTPIPSTPSTPSKPSPSPPTPKKSPPPPTPSPPHPAPKKSPPPPTPKKSPSPPSTPSLPPPTPKKSPSPPPTPKKSPSPPPTPKKSPSTPSTPTLPPPTPKKSPSPPPSDDHSPSPINPPPEHHQQNPWEHIESCMRNMGPVGMCRMQMEVSFYTRLFSVSDYCCNLVVNMESECDDVAWGFFNDPFFVPLVRYTCHVTC
ncbi:hypothetical protein ISN44_As10g018910 [Arabidopsis suecica]|uniref:Prolamin-like domain-containing protein n=1 Tax=Arabidopsis suecica TaxID=45249 RepID=A0A8T2A0C1_ARASU|nr:hypothetical protein ISN44_As10g018910 [Arabidopsis suecica]